MAIRVEQCANFEAIPSIMHGTPQFDPFHQLKNGQEWRVERRKIPQLPGSLDHYSAPHYSDIIMSAMASQIICVLIVYSTVWSGADQRKHQSSASLAFVRGIHRWHVNSPHKGPVTRNIFPFHDFILKTGNIDRGGGGGGGGGCSSMKCKVIAPL